MDREVLRFCGRRFGSDERGVVSAVAELMKNWAVRIEVGRMRHKRRTWGGGIDASPVERPLLTAVFLDPPSRGGIADRMDALGFTCLSDQRRSFADWAPVKVGEGFVPLGFFVERERSPRDEVDVSGDLALLLKFLAVRTDLVFKVIPGRRGWHVLTHHHSTERAERFRANMEREAPGLFEFD